MENAILEQAAAAVTLVTNLFWLGLAGFLVSCCTVAITRLIRD